MITNGVALQYLRFAKQEAANQLEPTNWTSSSATTVLALTQIACGCRRPAPSCNKQFDTPGVSFQDERSQTPSARRPSHGAVALASQISVSASMQLCTITTTCIGGTHAETINN
jgi:hypothetical protein